MDAKWCTIPTRMHYGSLSLTRYLSYGPGGTRIPRYPWIPDAILGFGQYLQYLVFAILSIAWYPVLHILGKCKYCTYLVSMYCGYSAHGPPTPRRQLCTKMSSDGFNMPQEDVAQATWGPGSLSSLGNISLRHIEAFGAHFCTELSTRRGWAVG